MQVAAAGIRGSELAELPVPVPPIHTQRKVSQIISTYDDLIENNTRRIKILEEMAQMIYREWFVNFRFPGHEEVKMAKSELGALPHGWLNRLPMSLTSGKVPDCGNGSLRIQVFHS